jgi:hypothetical protein
MRGPWWRCGDAGKSRRRCREDGRRACLLRDKIHRQARNSRATGANSWTERVGTLGTLQKGIPNKVLYSLHYWKSAKSAKCHSVRRWLLGTLQGVAPRVGFQAMTG